MRIDFIAGLAKEKAGLSAEFRMVTWEDFTHEGLKAQKFEYKNAPLITKGKNTGRPNWRAATETRTVWLTDAELYAATDAYEKQTGKCRECEGTAEVMASWNRDTGTKFKACPDCAGTGLAKLRIESREAK